jgi:hypothetical protein
MLMRSLFLIVNPWMFPLIDERIKKIWYIYTMEFHSTIKNEVRK